METTKSKYYVEYHTDERGDRRVGFSKIRYAKAFAEGLISRGVSNNYCIVNDKNDVITIVG